MNPGFNPMDLFQNNQKSFPNTSNGQTFGNQNAFSAPQDFSKNIANQKIGEQFTNNMANMNQFYQMLNNNTDTEDGANSNRNQATFTRDDLEESVRLPSKSEMQSIIFDPEEIYEPHQKGKKSMASSSAASEEPLRAEPGFLTESNRSNF